MEQENKSPEILAPAGSMESLRAAVHAGCDAVYIGGDKFGARAYADNPAGEELCEAIRYCHLHGKKLYLTVNTLLKKEEIGRQLYDYLLPLYEEGLDAVIVQDMGVLSFIHTYFSDLDIHASTQMSLMAAEGAGWLKDYGVTRIVPARELSLEELQRMRRGLSADRSVQGEKKGKDFYMEIEVFVHGALCYCYSGQCLLSSMNGGRSGNRGRCAQPCRMPYRLESSGKDAAYLLSPKELCLLPFLPELFSAGVDSLKIEGRMKKPEYTALTTAVYRKYTDLYQKLGEEEYRRLIREQPAMLEKDMENLAQLYNRNGFTAGYLLGNKQDMLSAGRPNHNGIPVGEVRQVKKGQALVHLEKDIDAGDIIEFRNEKEEAVYEYTAGACSGKGKMIWVRFLPSAPVKRGNLLYRMRKKSLLAWISETYLQKEPQLSVRGRVTGQIGKPLTLQLSLSHPAMERYEATVRGMCCEKPKKSPLPPEEIKSLMEKTGQERFCFEDLCIDLKEPVFLPLKEIKELRRRGFAALEEKMTDKNRRMPPPEKRAFLCSAVRDRADEGNACAVKKERQKERPRLAVQILQKKQMKAVLQIACVDRLYIPISLFWKKHIWDKDGFSSLAGAEKEIFLALPHICRKDTYDMLEGLLRQNPEIMDFCAGFLIRNQEEYRLVQSFFQPKEFCKGNFMEIPCVLDYNMYIMNPWAADFWRGKAASWYLPQELDYRELADLVQGMEQSYGMLVYGRQALMVSAQCVLNNTGGCASGKKQFVELKDRKNASFYSYNQCDACYNILYSGKPLWLLEEKDKLNRLAPAELRLDFTMESPEEIEEILGKTEKKVLSEWGQAHGREKGEMDKSRYTTGHFHKRIQ